MDFAKISNYTIEIYLVLFYFGQRLYLSGVQMKDWAGKALETVNFFAFLKYLQGYSKWL
jgi:hypothetical protein